MNNKFLEKVKYDINEYDIDFVDGNHVILFNDEFVHLEPLFTHHYVTQEEAVIRAYTERERISKSKDSKHE